MLKIPENVKDAVAKVKLPSDQRFGKAVLPYACVSDFKDGKWGPLSLKHDNDMLVSAASPAVQYAQSIFEGMKAFKVTQDTPQIFRAYDHAKRFNISGARMCIPPVPEDIFISAVKTIAALYKDHYPADEQCAMYLRPSAYGTDVSLTIEPSEAYRFTVHAAPTLPFATTMKSVFIERTGARSSVGGTGHVKAAGNYAGSYLSLLRAQKRGCATTLWLDPLERRYIDELSLMNFFAVIDGVLTTPTLNGTFLPGFTRQSLIKLANHMDVPIAEKRIEIDALIKGIQSGAVTEAFSSGTAAVVSPIRSLMEDDGTEYIIGQAAGPITTKLKTALTDIQKGKAEDIFGWMTDAA